MLVLTRKANETTATRWVSAGAGSYEIEAAERDEAGTTITLQLKPADPDNGVHDYADEWVLGDDIDPAQQLDGRRAQ